MTGSARSASRDGGRAPATSRRHGRCVLALAAVLAIALAACGDDEGEDTAPPPQETGAAEGGDTTTEGAAGPTTETVEDGEGQQPAEQSPGSGECVFVAPQGRLAEGEIAIELSGVDCEQGRSLARAAALGQPAGANLTIARDGFRCLPSTTAKGANVTYTCAMGSAEVSFDVVWSAEG